MAVSDDRAVGGCGTLHSVQDGEPGGRSVEYPAASVATPSLAAAPRRPWWAPAPDPVLPLISTARAYTEVLLVFAAFFLTGIVGAVQLLSGEYKNPLTNASWGLYAPEALDLLVQIGLALAVVLLLCARRGVGPKDLGLTLPKRTDGRFAAGQATRIAAWAMFALVLGGIVNSLLQTGHLPTTKATGPELLFAVGDSLQAGVIEELVVLAFVVVTLRQARRPWWEVTVVALVLRGSYHIYYGPGVFGILVWAALYYWLYVRTRSLLILMACHAGWDAVGFLSERWAAVAVFGALIVAALWIAAPITWLVERSSARQLVWYPAGNGSRPTDSMWSPGIPSGGAPAPPGVAGGAWSQTIGAGAGAGAGGGAGPPPQPQATGPWSPPGWQPDPSGMHHWRWWDGQRWTEHVSGP